jgi:hypothetical protein
MQLLLFSAPYTFACSLNVYNVRTSYMLYCSQIGIYSFLLYICSLPKPEFANI